MVAPIDGAVPDPAELDDPDERAAIERALAYMGLEPGTPLREIHVDRVFIGSCTNCADRGSARGRARSWTAGTCRPAGARDGRPGIGDR